VWVGHSCPTALDVDFDFAEDDQDVCSKVEDRRFSAALSTRVEQAFMPAGKVHSTTSRLEPLRYERLPSLSGFRMAGISWSVRKARWMSGGLDVFPKWHTANEIRFGKGTSSLVPHYAAESAASAAEVCS
jgi:hypothetical protein